MKSHFVIFCSDAHTYFLQTVLKFDKYFMYTYLLYIICVFIVFISVKNPRNDFILCDKIREITQRSKIVCPNVSQ